MKRIQFYIVLALAVLLTGTIIVWHHSQSTISVVSTNVVSNTTSPPPANSETTVASRTSTTATNVPRDLARMATEQNQKFAKMIGVTPDMTPDQVKQKVLEWYQAQSAKMATQDQRPIEFFGETVDVSNQPVAGVNVDLSLSEPPNPGQHGTLEANLQSDAQGYFHYGDAIGKVLEVRLNKDGYYISKSNRVDFDYTSYQPNPLRPELFYLRKKGSGADLITSQYGMKKYLGVPMPLADSPVHVNLLTRSIGQEGQLILTQIKLAGAPSWSFKMEIPGGGFLEEGDEFPFEAPESGYQSVVEFKFQQGQADWATDILKDYYIKFGNPPRYGHLHLDTAIDMTGARLTYVINPDGSGYLEPK